MEGLWPHPPGTGNAGSWAGTGSEPCDSALDLRWAGVGSFLGPSEVGGEDGPRTLWGLKWAERPSGRGLRGTRMSSWPHWGLAGREEGLQSGTHLRMATPGRSRVWGRHVLTEGGWETQASNLTTLRAAVQG